MVRETIWGDVVGTAQAFTSPSQAFLLNVTGSVFLDLRPFTVVRARGVLYLKSDQAAAAENQAVNFGICVASDQAVLIGSTALPTPTTDQGSDLWLTYQSVMANATDLTDLAIAGQFVQYDSRAMRRVEPGAQVVFLAETEVAGLTDGCQLRHTGRLLIKLH